jgi:hypothetical protein
MAAGIRTSTTTEKWETNKTYNLASILGCDLYLRIGTWRPFQYALITLQTEFAVPLQRAVVARGVMSGLIAGYSLCFQLRNVDAFALLCLQHGLYTFLAGE